ncbi:cytochrome c oxidase subunit I [Natrarchaeobius chitinivorans]|uniref:Cytochrome C oxidase subunit I n=1 Tax=Natrarchaeobius chitinivorans TaxID=1679083 RepID=A0A3N6LX76_NATCH|nr:cbb3-type cytochrome c oxidase subunit I [Natrarchaeobius chitinivorans]RQG95348.1 cytochrome C oxidase subunit I [Natrarchaeobius chitinivorans]
MNASRLDVLGLFDHEYDDDGWRTCSVTGLEIHSSTENYAKLFGLTAVVALLVGGLFAITVPLTRWELVGLLEPADFYIHLSMHAWNLLIFWMVFMEISILYVGGPLVLGRKLPITTVAKAGWGTMVAGAVLVNYAIWTTTPPDQAPLLTAYAPLPSAPLFYVGAVVFLLGATIAALPFFLSMWQEKRENPGKTLPLVAFGAFVTSIIAVQAILGGLAVFTYALLWRVEIISSIDASVYRHVYWIVGHGTQQINLVAMITVWYFLTHVVGGAEVVSEKVSRTAFILYLFFINLGAAHHLLSEPVVELGWRLFNTSYAFYGAAFASMIHAFAIPAGLEAGRRKRGKGGGLFGWLTSAPWHNPVFSSVVLSVILFGFIGGITGVVMGQLQLNMTWQNTFATVGHFHGTVVLGTTFAFMGLILFLLQTSFDRKLALPRLASLWPYLFASTMGITALMMMYVGLLYGVPRRVAEVVENIPGTEFNLVAAAPLFNVFGVFAMLAVVSGALFLVIALATLLFGKRNGDGEAAERLLPDGTLKPEGGASDPVHAYEMRGTFVLTLVFMGVFVVTWALNWYLLSQLWSIGL